MVKRLKIEDFLEWAFVQELWKAGSGEGGGAMASSWSMVSDFADLGTLIDRSPNAYGVLPGFEVADIHPDALAAGDAVRRFALCGGLDIGPGWNPLPEFDDVHGLIAEEVDKVVTELAIGDARRSAGQIVALVTTCAILKRGPDWHVDPPDIRMVERHGKPCWFVLERQRDRFGRVFSVETDGFNARAGRPKPGAYRRYRLAEPLRGAILSRLDWQIWQDALATLAASLPPLLRDHDLLPFVPDRAPWTRRSQAA